MNYLKIWFLISIIWLQFNSSTSLANTCKKAISSKFEFDPFKRYENVESKFYELSKETASLFLKGEKGALLANKAINSLESVRLELETLEETVLNSEDVPSSQFENLELSLTEIEKTIRNRDHSEKKKENVNDVNQALLSEKPLLDYFKPNHVHKIKKTDQENSIKVLLSENILKDIRQNKVRPETQKALFQSIRKGVFGGGYKKAGIIKLQQDSSVVELRTLGSHARVRLFGYINSKGVVSFVSYSGKGNHSVKNISTQIKKVKKIRRERND